MTSAILHISAIIALISIVYAIVAVPVYRSKKRQQIELGTFNKKQLYKQYEKPYFILIVICIVFYSPIATMLFYPEGGVWGYPKPMETYIEEVLSDGKGVYMKGKVMGTRRSLRPRKDRQWNIPTDPQEKAAYDYAHSLKLPGGAPKPVPFNFFKARVKHLYGGKPVDEQYFKHLCETERGEYIFRTVENVEGIFQLRPVHKLSNKVIDYDRYAMEGLAKWAGADSDDNYNTFISARYVKPVTGKYRYLEQPKMKQPGMIFRLVRADEPVKLEGNTPWGYSSSYQTLAEKKGHRSHSFRIPWMIKIEEDSKRLSRFGYTWRGLKRPNDREYAIAGGEYLIIDLETNEVLGLFRDFMKSGKDRNTPSRIWWGNARGCSLQSPKSYDIYDKSVFSFMKYVLNPIKGLNDKYIPEDYSHLRELEN